jgi:RNA polymerase sigma-70 factor (ECF subfamily)
MNGPAPTFHASQTFFVIREYNEYPRDGVKMFSSPSSEANLEQQYEGHLQLIRERIVDFATPKIGRDRAEDVAQGCLLLLMQKYSNIRDLTTMLKISVGIARNKIFEQFRQDKREIQFPEATSDHVNTFEAAVSDRTDILRELERRQLVDRILAAMLHLGEKCRNLLRLKLVEHKGSADIQKLLGVNSINTVYTWERRCLQELINMAGGTLYVRTD